MLKPALRAVPALLSVLVLVLPFTASLSRSAQAQVVTLYVDGDDGLATPAAGDQWADAFLYLQDALAEAGSLIIGEEADAVRIWVKDREGGAVYLADECATCGPGGAPGGSGDRAVSFILMNDVAIYGGFNGTEDALEDRAPGSRSILSGDLDGNDNPGEFVAGDYDTYDNNSYHVIFSTEVDGSAVVDGFAVIGGNADGVDAVGGGMWSQYLGAPRVEHCMFTHNFASDSGGAVHSQGSSDAQFRNCLFTENHCANDGGAAVNYDSDCVYARCRFVENQAGSDGGAMVSRSTSFVTITNCLFIDNEAVELGGAIFMPGYGTSGDDVANTLFAGNAAGVAGGAIYAYHYSTPLLINCTLVGNAAGDGSALYCFTNGAMTVKNSIIWDHDGDTVTADEGGVISVTYSDVEGGHSGVGNINADPCFVNAAGGDFGLLSTSPCINKGNNVDIPDDVADLDEDAITTGQETPIDLAEGARRIGLAVDMGAFEFQVTCGAANLGGSDCEVNGIDQGILLSQWTGDIAYGGCPLTYRTADFNHDCKVNGIDLGILLNQWGPCNCAESFSGGGESLLSMMETPVSEAIMEWPAEASIDDLWAWYHLTYGIYPDEAQ